MQYEIKGTPFPAVICHLQDGEQMITEGGGMSWMTPNMVMETTTNGGLGKAFGRLFSGDKMFHLQAVAPATSVPLKFIRVSLSFAKKVHF